MNLFEKILFAIIFIEYMSLFIHRRIKMLISCNMEDGSLYYLDTETKEEKIFKPKEDECAKWEWAGRAGHTCSKCGEPSPSTSKGKDMPTPYCPWCGKKMKEASIIFKTCC